MGKAGMIYLLGQLVVLLQFLIGLAEMKDTKQVEVKGRERSYYLIKQIGKGTFGSVYQYQNYAIKRIQNVSKYDTAVQRQINILSELNHPNLVKVQQIIHCDKQVYIVMELCQTNLREYMKKIRSEAEVAIIMKQLVQGYKKLSELGIIHRDLKPENILVKNGCFKIADFGTARFTSSNGLYTSVVGTTLYMPVQFLQRKEYTYKCDIWSLGIIFYELLFKRRPWGGYNQKSLLSNITECIPYPKDWVSPLAKKIVERMLVTGEKERMDLAQLESYFDIYELSFSRVEEKKYHRSKINKMLKVQVNHLIKSQSNLTNIHNDYRQQAIKKSLMGSLSAEYCHLAQLYFQAE